MSCKQRVYAGQDISLRLQLDPDGCAGLNAGDISSCEVFITKRDGTEMSKIATVDGIDAVLELTKTESVPSGIWTLQPWCTMTNGAYIPGKAARVMFYKKGRA